MKSILACLAILLSLSSLLADIPSLINYQGLLTDNNGNVVTGNKAISIAIYDASTNGTLLYSENIGTITVQNGVYSFQFGSGPGFATALAATGQHWLQVTIDSVAQTPRERLVSVPFAIKAASADALAPAPEADLYVQFFSAGSLVDGIGSAIVAPVFLPISSRPSFSRSIYQPISTSIKHISELAGKVTTTISTGTLTLRIIRRDHNGTDTTLATVQKNGAASTSTVTVATDLTLDHANYLYFIEAAFVGGDSNSTQTTLHWARLHAGQ